MRKYSALILILVLICCKKETKLVNDGSRLWRPNPSGKIDDGKVTLKWLNYIIYEDILRPYRLVNPDFFDIYKSDGKPNSFSKVIELKNDNKYEYNFLHLSNNSPYYFYVVAKKDGYLPLYSDTIMVVPNQRLSCDTLVKLSNNQSIVSVSYSPVTQKIAYVDKNYAWNGGQNCCMAVSIILSSITNQDSELLDINSYEPDWSPDGNKIVFRTEKGEVNLGNGINSEIALYDISTKSILRLTNDTCFNYNPVFSPNGEKILYQSSKKCSVLNSTNIWLMDINGTNTLQITNVSTSNLINAARPNWIGENDFIFQGTKSNYKTNIFKSSIRSEIIVPLFESDWDDYRPAISPDSNLVAFISDRSGNLELWLYNLQTKEYKQLTGYSNNDYLDFDWTKIDWVDNNQILFTFGDNRLAKITLK